MESKNVGKNEWKQNQGLLALNVRILTEGLLTRNESRWNLNRFVQNLRRFNQGLFKLICMKSKQRYLIEEDMTSRLLLQGIKETLLQHLSKCFSDKKWIHY